MKKTVICSAGAAVMLLVSTAVNAQGSWLVRGGFETGGDTIFDVEFTNGDTEELEAGGLFHIEIGRQLSLLAQRPDSLTELSIGYKADSVSATNGDLAFNRITLNAVQFINYSDKVRFGLGVTYHMSPTVEVDFFGINDEFETDDALGFMLLADYALSERSNIGARATQIDYETDESDDISGNSFGLYFTYYF
ncbi:MAG: outer membrane beta-barrel protein [Granulosicoccus sp.]